LDKAIASGLKIYDLDIRIDNLAEILGMGGPWTCSLYLQDRLISHSCMLNNFLADKACEKVFFVKYHCPTNRRVDIYFTLNYLVPTKREIYQSNTRFNALYLDKFLDEENTEIVNAFHNNSSKRGIFNVGKESFELSN